MATTTIVRPQLETGEAERVARGPLPYRVWIGVTGHRRLPGSPELPKQVREALAKIKHLLPAPRFTEVQFGVVSSLADGADRMVAREVAQRVESLASREHGRWMSEQEESRRTDRRGEGGL